MHVRDFKIRLDSLEKIEIEYDGPHGGLYTRYVRDIETFVQFFRSKAHEAGIGVRGLRITLEDKNTPSKAIMELGELVPDEKFWACPTCTRVNPSTRKTCYMKHGEEGADDE